MGYLMEEIMSLQEGTRYDAKAAEILAQAPDVRDLDQAKFIIQQLFKSGDIPAFTHAKPWLEKYLIGIARMYKEENEKGVKLPDLINQTVHDFDVYLTWVKANRTNENAAKLDNTFNNVWHLDDFKKFLYDLREEERKADADALSNQQYEEVSNYELIPIHSYQELHDLFGGTATGDGQSAKAADNTNGTGNTAWCHANKNDLYRSHTDNGMLQMFVLAANNWKDIPPEKTEGNPKDAYGLSLIAIITDRRAEEVLETTLRWNHVGVPNNADHQMDSWSELSKVAGFNVQEKAKELMPPMEEDEVTKLKTVFDKLVDGEGEWGDLSQYEFNRIHAFDGNIASVVGTGYIYCDLFFNNCELKNIQIEDYSFQYGLTFKGGTYKGIENSSSDGFYTCEFEEITTDDTLFDWFHFRNSEINNGEFNETHFYNVSFGYSKLKGCTFDGCMFKECRFLNADFENCDFSSSEFDFYSMLKLASRGSTFSDCAFSKAVEQEITNMVNNPNDSKYDNLPMINDKIVERLKAFLSNNRFI